MKKNLQSFYAKLACISLVLMFFNISVKAEAYTVHVNTPGELQNIINVEVGAGNYSLITSLTVTGSLNGSDILFLQEELGENLTVLQDLDISGISLPNNTLEAFAFSRVSIKSIILPNSVTTFEWQCFRNSTIEHLKIGKNTEILYEDNEPGQGSNMDYTAFSGATNMKTYEVAEDNIYFKSIDGVIYSNDGKDLVAYPANNARSEFQISEGVETICFSAFLAARNLRTVIIPNSVKLLSDYAFSGSTGISNFQWGTGLKKIGYRAFAWATDLEVMDIPEGVTHVGYEAFFNTKGMSKIIFPSTLTNLSAECVRGDGMSGSDLITADLSKCVNLTSISEDCFYDNFKLQNIIFAEGLKSIGVNAFSNTYALQEVVFPNSLEVIGNQAFSMWSELYTHSLRKIKLGKNLHTIAEGAFQDCDQIMEIISLNPVPPTAQTAAFDNVLNQKAHVYVPIGSLTAYESANRWKDFKNISERDEEDENDPNAITTSNSNIKVYNSEEIIVIENATPGQTISVYSITGSLVKQKTVANHTEQIRVSNGIYIVRVDRLTKKIVL